METETKVKLKRVKVRRPYTLKMHRCPSCGNTHVIQVRDAKYKAMPMEEQQEWNSSKATKAST